MKFKTTLTLTTLLALSLGLGCNPPQEAPKKEAPANETPPAAEQVAAPAPKKVSPLAVPTGALALSGDITFVGRKVIGSNNFVFEKWSGYAQLNEGQIAGGSIEFQIETASVVANPGNRNKWTPKLEKHMKDPDFFDVAKFPTATFKSKSITAVPEAAPNQFQVTGDIVIKGITKELQFPATITLNEGKLNADAVVTIDRQDYGIIYPGKPDNLIQDDVVITFKIKS